jgi:hypothetical protein
LVNAVVASGYSFSGGEETLILIWGLMLGLPMVLFLGGKIMLYLFAYIWQAICLCIRWTDDRAEKLEVSHTYIKASAEGWSEKFASFAGVLHRGANWTWKAACNIWGKALDVVFGAWTLAVVIIVGVFVIAGSPVLYCLDEKFRQATNGKVLAGFSWVGGKYTRAANWCSNRWTAYREKRAKTKALKKETKAAFLKERAEAKVLKKEAKEVMALELVEIKYHWMQNLVYRIFSRPARWLTQRMREEIAFDDMALVHSTGVDPFAEMLDENWGNKSSVTKSDVEKIVDDAFDGYADWMEQVNDDPSLQSYLDAQADKEQDEQVLVDDEILHEHEAFLHFIKQHNYHILCGPARDTAEAFAPSGERAEEFTPCVKGLTFLRGCYEELSAMVRCEVEYNSEYFVILHGLHMDEAKVFPSDGNMEQDSLEQVGSGECVWDVLKSWEDIMSLNDRLVPIECALMEVVRALKPKAKLLAVGQELGLSLGKRLKRDSMVAAIEAYSAESTDNLLKLERVLVDLGFLPREEDFQDMPF